MAEADLPFVVYAAGGHARVVADALLASGREVLGFVDDDARRHGAEVLGLPVLSPAGFQELHRERPFYVALGIGDNDARRTVYERCLTSRLLVATVIHPAAVIARSARVGAGTVVLAGAVLNAEASTREGCIINTGAIVEHDVEVGAFAHVSPGATLAGGSKLGASSHLGANAVVIDDIVVGERTVVGAGAVVSRSLGDDVIAYGVPAKVRRRRGESR